MSLNNQYFFLRHAKVDRTQKVHFKEFDLDSEGREQAKGLIPFLSDFHFDSIYSSPFKRATQTIQAYADTKEIVINYDNRLSGRIINDLPHDRVWDFFERSWKDFDHTECGAESARDCYKRVESFIQEAETSYQNKKLLLVSHSNPIAFYLNSIDTNVGMDWFKKMKTPSLYKVTSRNGFEEIILPFT